MTDKKIYQTETCDSLLHGKMSTDSELNLQLQHKFMLNALKQSSAELRLS